MVSGSYHFLFLRIRIKNISLKSLPASQEGDLSSKATGPHPAQSPVRLLSGLLLTQHPPHALCLLPEVVCAAEAPRSLGPACSLLSSLGLSAAHTELVPPSAPETRSLTCSHSSGGLPCPCWLSLPPPGLSTSTVLWGPTPTSANVPAVPPTFSPGSPLEHYMDWFRNELGSKVPWEPKRRFRPGVLMQRGSPSSGVDTSVGR